MMIRKMPKWIAGVAIALIAGAAPLACGGGGGTDNMAGAGNDEDGTGGGGDTDGTGGNDTDGTGGNDTDGTGGTDGEAGGDGTGGTTTVGDASIDDLIDAICEWEFSCCNDGELTYRLGSAGDDVQDCIDVFTFQFHSSNTVDNPYPASGLLGTLGYVVVPSHVKENPAGIGECVAAYEAMGCPEEAEVLGYCEQPTVPGTDVCALGNLFNPDLDEGEECKDHAQLKEGFE